MAKEQGVKMPTGQRSKGAAQGAPSAQIAPAPAAAKKRTSPAEFVREVRAEARKISWPTWKETWVMSTMVFLTVVIAAVFFLLVDGALAFLIQQILKLAS